MNYTHGEVELIQRFVDFYRAAPEVITRSDRFCSFPMNDQERSNLELLTEKGLVEVKDSKNPGMPTFYRLSEATLPAIGKLCEEGKIKFQ